MEDYFSSTDDKKKNKSDASFSSCKAILNTKSKEESLVQASFHCCWCKFPWSNDLEQRLIVSQANFAKWEPWHGKFGLNYPWNRYLQIGEVLRELAATVLSIKGCLQSPRQVWTWNPKLNVSKIWWVLLESLIKFGVWKFGSSPHQGWERRSRRHVRWVDRPLHGRWRSLEKVSRTWKGVKLRVS